jgi:flagellar motor switch protein FliN/FliY
MVKTMRDNDMLSQEEIDLLLMGSDESSVTSDEDIITDLEKDTLGEIGNISMGTAATTLSTLLNRKVTITTPEIEITTASKLSAEYPIPFVVVDVKYKEGLEGSNVLIIKEDDVKIIADIMMGNEINLERELTDLDLSAISEVMNQMMGSAATSLSEMFSKKIDIYPPKSYNITIAEGEKTLEVLKTDGPIIKISFKMIVEDLIDSNIMQLIPIDFGQQLVENLIGDSGFSNSLEESETAAVEPIELDINNTRKDDGMRQLSTHPQESLIEEQVVVKKPKFETFDSNSQVSKQNESIDLVGDIPVELTVELGRTVRRIGEILEYGPGTVIELDKLVGEPLNIYANGKFIARGEVVVIDDNFGVRITDIDNNYGKNK